MAAATPAPSDDRAGWPAAAGARHGLVVRARACWRSASCWSRSGLPQNLQDVVVLTFLWAGLALAWNIAGGLCRADFVRARGVLRRRRLHLDHPAWSHYGVTPWIGTVDRRRSLAAAFGAVLALICARLRGPFFILSTLAAAEVVRIGALNWASLTGGPEGLSILPVAEPRQHGVRVEDRPTPR